MRPLPLVAVLMLLAACGSGGGAGGAMAPSSPAPVPSPGPAPATGDLGVRALPGYSVRIRQVGSATAGSPLTIRAAVTPAAGMPAAAAVEAAIAEEEPVDWIAASPDGEGEWSWTGVVPAVLPGCRAWIRVTDAEGNQGQSGTEDFALRP